MLTMPSLTRVGVLGLIVIGSVLIASCDDNRNTTEPTQVTEAPTTVTVPPTESFVPTASDVVPIVGVYEDVAFYPACGNETLDHLGTTWFPAFRPGRESSEREPQAEADALLAAPRAESPVQGIHGFTRVVSPGPGDDIGTLVIWADGVARWVSNSRDLDVWMINQKVAYSWEC
jgi:hypothetical protein